LEFKRQTKVEFWTKRYDGKLKFFRLKEVVRKKKKTSKAKKTAKKAGIKTRRRKKETKSYRWQDYSTSRLLEMRICDLGVSLKSSWVYECIEQLYSEIEAKGLNFRPHFWISDEWFSPDGIPGIAIPFYITHSRLQELNVEMLGEVEGADFEEVMRLLRHELGHAIDNAYGLRRNKARQKLFGKSTTPYLQSYNAIPYDRDFVVHLNGWYAQAHPDEDWAETFAVWFDPNSKWKKTYKNWPAIEKLHFIDNLMKEFKGKSPKVKNKYLVSPYQENKKTIASYYKGRERKIRDNLPPIDIVDFKKIFKSFKVIRANSTMTRASDFMIEHREEIIDRAVDWTGQNAVIVGIILDQMLEVAKQLPLFVNDPKSRTLGNIVCYLTAFITANLASKKMKVPA
jgi:hypothetical protein